MHIKLQRLYRLSIPFSFFNDFILIYPICNSMFLSHGMLPSERLSIIEFTSLFIFKQLAKIPFDVFSGFLGDKYGRKKLLIAAQLLRILTMTLWILYPCYLSFIGGTMLLGIAMSCFYGNIDAYVYDQLRLIDKQQEFAKFMGIYYAVSNIAITLAAFISSAIFSIAGFQNILLLCNLSIAISVIFAHLLPNHYARDTVRLDWDAKKEITACDISLKRSCIALKNNPSALFFAALIAISDAVFVLMIDLNTITMINMHIKEKNIAMLIGIMGIARICANILAGYTVQFFTVRRILLCLGSVGAILCCAAHYYNYLLVCSIMGYMTLSAFLDLSIRTRAQNVISSGIRATFMSISSLMSSVIVIILYAIYGTSIIVYSNQCGMYAMGGILLCTAAAMLAILRYNKILSHHARIT